MSRKNMQIYQEHIKAIQNNRKNNQEKKDVVTSTMYLIFWVLHDKCGFGNIKLKNLVKEIWKLNEDIKAGLYNTDDIIEQLREETSIEIKDGKIYMEE